MSTRSSCLLQPQQQTSTQASESGSAHINARNRTTHPSSHVVSMPHGGEKKTESCEGGDKPTNNGGMLTSLLRRVVAPFAPAPTTKSEDIPAIPFADLVDRYYEEHWRHLDSASQIESVLRCYLKPGHKVKKQPKAQGRKRPQGPGLGDIRCDQLTRDHVRAWRSAHQDAPRILNRALRKARQLWRELLPKAVNPFAQVKTYPEKSRKRRFTDDERVRFVKSLEALRETGEIEDVTADAMLVIRGTFARKGEILRLRRDHIDVGAEIALLDNHKTDDKEGARLIHLTLVMPIIRRRLAACEESGDRYLFPSKRSRCGHLTAIGPAFHKICRHAGIVRTRDLVVHTLRADGASVLLGSGVDMRVIQEILGHSDIGTTSGYASADTETSRAAVRSVRARFHANNDVPPHGTVIQDVLGLMKQGESAKAELLLSKLLRGAA